MTENVISSGKNVKLLNVLRTQFLTLKATNYTVYSLPICITQSDLILVQITKHKHIFITKHRKEWLCAGLREK